jgi:hypothetical protein
MLVIAAAKENLRCKNPFANPKLFSRNNPAWSSKDPKNKLKGSNLESEGS